GPRRRYEGIAASPTERCRTVFSRAQMTLPTAIEKIAARLRSARVSRSPDGRARVSENPLRPGPEPGAGLPQGTLSRGLVAVMFSSFATP
ncbi:MAG: hypothetical protein ACYSWT_17970, partial [Planctomycetota bacterium]